MAAWQRIRAVLDEPVEPDPAERIGLAPDGIGVEFIGVTFAHEGDGPPTVSDVDLAVRSGSLTALVGPTGSGKSTIAELAAGLVGPVHGEVRLAPGARAIVFQEAFLSSGTVRDEVEFGTTCTDDEIWDALDQAAVAEFVARLPQQIDTVVGARGVSLSGGQRQRLALARALVRHPSLLVLDDTTSALDPTTEALILEGLRSRLSGSTVLMVASRPSTIALADGVVFVADGRDRRARHPWRAPGEDECLPGAGGSLRVRPRGWWRQRGANRCHRCQFRSGGVVSIAPTLAAKRPPRRPRRSGRPVSPALRRLGVSHHRVTRPER